MPVKVSYLKSNSTDNGTGWTNHTHSLSVDDYAVPTLQEFRALERRIENCHESISEMEDRIADIRGRINDCIAKVMNAKRSSDAAAKKINGFATSLSDTGKLATVFKRIVETNLLKIQHENDTIARAVKRLTDLGIIKPEDQILVEKPESESQSKVRCESTALVKGVKKVKTSKTTKATTRRKSTKNVRR